MEKAYHYCTFSLHYWFFAKLRLIIKPILQKIPLRVDCQHYKRVQSHPYTWTVEFHNVDAKLLDRQFHDRYSLRL